MSQTDKKRRKLAMAIGESFAAVRRRTVRSRAFISLSAPALKVYIELRLRWRHVENNNGELFVSIAECKKLLGLAPGTAHRAFCELAEKGFIVKTRQGEACGLTTAVLDNGGFGYSRRATTWRLTDEPYRLQPATHDYEKWQPSQELSAGANSQVIENQKTFARGRKTGSWFHQWNYDSYTSGTMQPQ
jgi:hypothetical protein